MKYIRTKDGIYDIEKYGGIMTIIKVYDVDESLRPKYENTNEPHQVGDQFISIGGKDYKIIDSNIAATIEELCDAFVDTSELKTTNTGGWLYDEFDSDNKCLVYYEHDERKTIPLNEFDDLSKIFGAIWTDKGLIYVAKMNEKGELELL